MMAIRRIGVRRFRDLIALHRRQPSEPTEIKSP
jgi:hypothetical protein